MVVCAGELVEGSMEDLGCNVPFSWLFFRRPARGLGRDFTCPAGAGLHLLWLQRKGHGVRYIWLGSQALGRCSAAGEWDEGCWETGWGQQPTLAGTVIYRHSHTNEPIPRTHTNLRIYRHTHRHSLTYTYACMHAHTQALVPRDGGYL